MSNPRSDNDETRSRILQTVFYSLAALLILLILIAIRRELGIKADSLVEISWLGLALIPLVTWLLLSGKIAELGFGDYKIKLLTQVSKAPLDDTFRKDAIVAAEGHAEKGRMGLLPGAILQDPIFLCLRLGVDRYTDQDIEGWIEHLLLTAPSFRYVGFLDKEGKLLAYMPAGALLIRLKPDLIYAARSEKPAPPTGTVEELSKHWAVKNPEHIPISNGLRAGRFPLPFSPEIRKDWVQLGATNREALAYMRQNKCEDTAVVDNNGHLVGLIKRSDIIDRFVTSLVLEDAPKS